jgi:hypothetical protein
MKFELSATEALILIAQTKFSPFNESDWEAFAGCESKNPLIGFNGSLTIVIDGEELVNIIHEDDEFGGQIFKLKEINYEG